MLDMEEYVKDKLKNQEEMEPERAIDGDSVLTEAERSQLRQVAVRIGWLGRGCRPHLVFSQIEMSTKFLNGKVKDLKEALKAVRKVKSGKNFIKF